MRRSQDSTSNKCNASVILRGQKRRLTQGNKVNKCNLKYELLVCDGFFETHRNSLREYIHLVYKRACAHTHKQTHTHTQVDIDSGESRSWFHDSIIMRLHYISKPFSGHKNGPRRHQANISLNEIAWYFVNIKPSIRAFVI